MLTRPIPSTGEAMPVIGLGTWQAFDVGGSKAELAPRREVIDVLLQAGGTMIDSSPMYGRAETIVGDLIGSGGLRPKTFLATKVWTSGAKAGLAQMQASAVKMQAGGALDLMQIHNLLDWRTHLPNLRAMKADGKIRYLGITHYTVSALDDLADVIRQEPVDFVQLAYSLAVRAAETRLFPLAQERGVAIIANRPFESGRMFEAVRGKPLPGWAIDIGATSWSKVFLKYILAHPAMTVAIPATAKPAHMRDNCLAGSGSLPDAALRKRMAQWWDGL